MSTGLMLPPEKFDAARIVRRPGMVPEFQARRVCWAGEIDKEHAAVPLLTANTELLAPRMLCYVKHAVF